MTMKNKILLFAMLLGGLSACDLNINPISDQSEINLSTKDTTDKRIKYKDRAAMEAVYKNLYTVMRDRQEHWYLDYLLFSETRSDNAYAGTTGNEIVPVETNALDASNPDIARDWDRYLEDIAAANAVISNIDLVPDKAFSQDERNQWKAEAKIFRAMMIFDMARWWGNIPLNLSEAPDITAENIEEVYPIYFPKPSTQVEAYQQVIKDLNEALPYAPNLNPSDKTLLSKTVAYAILARAYAEMGNWQEVIKYCNLIEADGIRLEDDYRTLWKFDATTKEVTRNSREVILEMQYNSGSGNWVSWMFGRDYNDPEYSFTWAKWITPSRDLMAAFDAAGDTIRRNQTIVFEACTWSNYYPAEHYPFMYKCRSGLNSIIKLRGGDFVLLKAEALARTHQDGEALALVNQIRTRVKLPALNGLTGEKLLDAILNERRLELALEGSRFFDLIRFGKLLEVMNTLNSRDEGRLPQSRPFVENHRLMPIPQTALDQNVNLTQNPGY